MTTNHKILAALLAILLCGAIRVLIVYLPSLSGLGPRLPLGTNFLEGVLKGVVIVPVVYALIENRWLRAMWASIGMSLISGVLMGMSAIRFEASTVLFLTIVVSVLLWASSGFAAVWLADRLTGLAKDGSLSATR